VRVPLSCQLTGTLSVPPPIDTLLPTPLDDRYLGSTVSITSARLYLL
jgi:hypothetical protein